MPADPTVGAVLPPLLRSHAAAVDAAHRLAGELEPGAAERDQSREVPWDALRALSRSGLLSITLPSWLDGPELGAVTLAEVIRVIAAADPAIAQVPQVHFVLPHALYELGSRRASARLAQVILAGGRIGNAIAERGGQHAQDLVTRLTRTGTSVVLRGTKYYCTGAISASMIGVTALDEEDRQVLVFVPRNAPGVQVDDDWAVMGQRATVSGTSTFDAVEVDKEFVVPYEQLFEGPQTLGARAQLIHAAIEVGIARGALDDASRFLNQHARPFFEAVRGGWAERAVDDPYTAQRFGEFDVRVHAAEALLREAAAVVDDTPWRPDDPVAAAEASVAVARAKAYGSEVAVDVASALFALAGTSATASKYALDRHWRNARTHSVHDPVSWKYRHIGNWVLQRVAPPNHGQI